MFVMRDGQIRRPQLSDVKEVAERDERIRQLEKQCAGLAAEVDRQRPVVEAVKAWKWQMSTDDDLIKALDEYYEASNPKRARR